MSPELAVMPSTVWTPAPWMSQFQDLVDFDMSIDNMPDVVPWFDPNNALHQKLRLILKGYGRRGAACSAGCKMCNDHTVKRQQNCS